MKAYGSFYIPAGTDIYTATDWILEYEYEDGLWTSADQGFVSIQEGDFDYSFTSEAPSAYDSGTIFRFRARIYDHDTYSFSDWTTSPVVSRP